MKARERERYIANLTVLCCAVDLGSKAITRIAGNALSTRLEETELSISVYDVLTAKIGQRIRLNHGDKEDVIR